MNLKASLLFIPLLLQGVAMGVDEGLFHHRRGLGAWERIGHPIDSFFFACCSALAWLVAKKGNGDSLFNAYLLASAISCAVITKDESIHLKFCSAQESWLHSVLFILHPICLFTLWKLALARNTFVLEIVLGSILLFIFYQIFYWNLFYEPKTGQ